MNYSPFKEEKFSFIYITTKDCKVCKILKPRLQELAKKYKYSTFHTIELDNHKDASGYFMAFTIPTFLAFSQGKELLRASRHLDFTEIENKLDRYYKMIF